jgi:hypothetical protein
MAHLSAKARGGHRLIGPFAPGEPVESGAWNGLARSGQRLAGDDQVYVEAANDHDGGSHGKNLPIR